MTFNSFDCILNSTHATVVAEVENLSILLIVFVILFFGSLYFTLSTAFNSFDCIPWDRSGLPRGIFYRIHFQFFWLYSPVRHQEIHVPPEHFFQFFWLYSAIEPPVVRGIWALAWWMTFNSFDCIQEGWEDGHILGLLNGFQFFWLYSWLVKLKCPKCGYVSFNSFDCILVIGPAEDEYDEYYAFNSFDCIRGG